MKLLVARARNIKPSFFTNEVLVELPFEARLLFIGLWTLADREGRLEDRPKRIKMSLFPADDLNIDKLLSGLSEKGFIQRYEINDNKYIQILSFAKHQNPHVKESASTIPAPCEHHTEQMHTQDENGASHADSLIPDSPSPIKTLSRSQVNGDVVHRILDFLNDKTEKNYRPVKVNLDLIRQRLREGATEQQCRAVIAIKKRQWQGTDMEQYLRPKTLFNRTNFWQYHAELPK